MFVVRNLFSRVHLFDGKFIHSTVSQVPSSFFVDKRCGNQPSARYVESTSIISKHDQGTLIYTIPPILIGYCCGEEMDRPTYLVLTFLVCKNKIVEECIQHSGSKCKFYTNVGVGTCGLGCPF